MAVEVVLLLTEMTLLTKQSTVTALLKKSMFTLCAKLIMRHQPTIVYLEMAVRE